MTTYEPGTVALVMAKHGPGPGDVYPMSRYSGGWALLTSPDYFWTDENARVIRPLVVIDPEDRVETSRLADLFCDARWDHTPGSEECDPLTRTAMREALANYVQPKPSEPTGLGAVVADDRGKRWVRVRDGFAWKWRDDHLGEQTSWEVIAQRNPQTLSEGVSA